MGAFDRYLYGQGLLLGLGATAVLSVTMVLSQSQRLVQAVTDFGMPIETFLALLGTLVPYMVDGSLFVGIVMGVTWLLIAGRNNNELVICQALGQTPMRRFLPFLVLGGTLGVVQLVWSHFVVPPTYRFHQETRREYRQEVNFLDLLTPGVTLDITPTTSIYFEQKTEAEQFRGIRMVDSTNPDIEMSTFANRGAIYANDSGLSILLFDGFQVQDDSAANLPGVMTFTAIPIAFDRNGSGFANGRISASTEKQPTQPGRGSTRNSGEDQPGTGLAFHNQWDVASMTPSEIPAGVSLGGAGYVLSQLGTSLDLRAQGIRVPSNEFHRRLASAISIPIMVWMIFAFLAADYHLRRSPVASYVVIALVAVVTLLTPRIVMEGIARDEPRNFALIYMTAVIPLPFIAAKILLGRR